MHRQQLALCIPSHTASTYWHGKHHGRATISAWLTTYFEFLFIYAARKSVVGSMYDGVTNYRTTDS
jgi:hypothetical protein